MLLREFEQLQPNLLMTTIFIEQVAMGQRLKNPLMDILTNSLSQMHKQQKPNFFYSLSDFNDQINHKNLIKKTYKNHNNQVIKQNINHKNNSNKKSSQV